MKKNIQRDIALLAGFSLLIMAIAAGFALGYVFDQLIIPTNATATAANINTHPVLFRLGILSWLLILVCDVLAAWALYLILKPVHPSRSLLSAWLRLIYSVFLAIALFSLLLVLLLQSNPTSFNAFSSDQIANWTLFFIKGFQEIWSLGLIVFGVHLLVLGQLVYRSDFIPKLFGILIFIAAWGYLILHLGHLVLPHFEQYKTSIEMVFMLPMIAGELGLGIWLIFKGGK